MLSQYRGKSISHKDIITPARYHECVRNIINEASHGGTSAKLKTIIGAATFLAIENDIDEKSFCELMDIAKDTYKELKSRENKVKPI